MPDRQPGFEAWNGEPFAHGEDYFEIAVQLPVVGDPVQTAAGISR